MIYSLEFLKQAKKEWDKLDSSIKAFFKKKLREVLVNPRIEQHRLTGFQDCYKLKLRSSGYRLVYQVLDEKIIVQVIAIAKRDKHTAYKLARQRLSF